MDQGAHGGVYLPGWAIAILSAVAIPIITIALNALVRFVRTQFRLNAAWKRIDLMNAEIQELNEDRIDLDKRLSMLEQQVQWYQDGQPPPGNRQPAAKRQRRNTSSMAIPTNTDDDDREGG